MSFNGNSILVVEGYYDMLICPVCRSNNMHISGPSFSGKTDDLYKDDTIEIPMYGECGHAGVLSVYTHKGSTYLRWHSIEDPPPEDAGDDGCEPPPPEDEPPEADLRPEDDEPIEDEADFGRLAEQ